MIPKMSRTVTTTGVTTRLLIMQTGRPQKFGRPETATELLGLAASPAGAFPQVRARFGEFGRPKFGQNQSSVEFGEMLMLKMLPNRCDQQSSVEFGRFKIKVRSSSVVRSRGGG